MKQKPNAFSILIPVYNFDVQALVKQLHQLCLQQESAFQILLIDDNSSKTFQDKLKSLVHLQGIEIIFLAENIGRAKIRNLLFEKAKYDHCIIMDCDVLLAKENFLSEYLQHLNQENIVVGGHIYTQNPPKDKSKYFHWLYGRRVESKSLDIRKKNAYHSFMTNSFACNKKLFSSLKFNENLTQYGHEDTLFGLLLKEKKIPIVHIFNPVVHIGLDNKKAFFQKQEKAIENLVYLYQNEQLKPQLAQQIKLIRFYETFQASFLVQKIINALHWLCQLSWLKNKNSIQLIYFNLWKIKQFKEKMLNIG